jgi:hypothetical protein
MPRRRGPAAPRRRRLSVPAASPKRTWVHRGIGGRHPPMPVSRPGGSQEWKAQRKVRRQTPARPWSRRCRPPAASARAMKQRVSRRGNVPVTHRHDNSPSVADTSPYTLPPCSVSTQAPFAMIILTLRHSHIPRRPMSVNHLFIRMSVNDGDLLVAECMRGPSCTHRRGRVQSRARRSLPSDGERPCLTP